MPAVTWRTFWTMLSLGALALVGMGLHNLLH